MKSLIRILGVGVPMGLEIGIFPNVGLRLLVVLLIYFVWKQSNEFRFS